LAECEIAETNRIEPFDSPAARLLLASFMAEIAALYPGWEPSRGPSAKADDFVAPGGAFLVAYDGNGRPVACGGLKRLDEATAEIKRVYVAPEARGAGVGRRLLAALEDVARERGYDVVRLDTGADQPGALRLFRTAGYRQIADYNDNPFARYWFEKQLRG
jgi:GNAT superfamily N-acetyltransferase